jgi:hypothetical protein
MQQKKPPLTSPATKAMGTKKEVSEGSIEGWREFVDYGLYGFGFKVRALYTNPPGFS